MWLGFPTGLFELVIASLSLDWNFGEGHQGELNVFLGFETIHEDEGCIGRADDLTLQTWERFSG